MMKKTTATDEKALADELARCYVRCAIGFITEIGYTKSITSSEARSLYVAMVKANLSRPFSFVMAELKNNPQGELYCTLKSILRNNIEFS